MYIKINSNISKSANTWKNYIPYMYIHVQVNADEFYIHVIVFTWGVVPLLDFLRIIL